MFGKDSANADSGRLRVAQVDVFTSKAFGGNPAGVLFLEGDAGAARWHDDTWMGQVAGEMACSNTAFARARSVGDGHDLRWFTSAGVEVALCGHATLATAHLLYEGGQLAPDAPARFHTQSGVLTATRRHDGAVEMDFPLEPALPVASVPDPIREGIPAALRWVGRNRLDYVIEVADESTLRALVPNLALLAEVETRGFVVTAAADDASRDGYDYVLRFFGPRVGVPEDLVTGTAHCALAPYWQERLGGRTRFTALQTSRRSGLVAVERVGSRVRIGGQAVTVLEGTMRA